MSGVFDWVHYPVYIKRIYIYIYMYIILLIHLCNDLNFGDDDEAQYMI